MTNDIAPVLLIALGVVAFVAIAGAIVDFRSRRRGRHRPLLPNRRAHQRAERTRDYYNRVHDSSSQWNYSNNI